MTGEKTVETRGYPLPERYLNKNLALIETQGGRPKGSSETQARITGVVRFSSCFRYESVAEWAKDSKRHKVKPADPNFRFDATDEKWGWKIDMIVQVDPPVAPPKRRGIKYAKKCIVPVANLRGDPASVARLIETK